MHFEAGNWICMELPRIFLVSVKKGNSTAAPNENKNRAIAA